MSYTAEHGNGQNALTGPHHDVSGYVTDNIHTEAHAAPPTAIGLVRDARHRYSWNGGPLYPSVTTILGIKDKPALVGWAKRETAACAVRNLDVLERMVRSGGPQAATDWLKRIPDYARDASADLGSAVHAAAEGIARGQSGPVAEDVAPFVAAYRRDFLDVFHPRFIAVEAMVCSERYEYGGTADAFAEIDGEVWLLDYKTGAGVYPDTALQLAGLARAQFIGYPGDPTRYPVPFATRFGVLHIRPEGARLLPVVVNRETVAAFLDARRLFGWDQGPAKTVIGEPITRAATSAAA
jgi:hypothetical protein